MNSIVYELLGLMIETLRTRKRARTIITLVLLFVIIGLFFLYLTASAWYIQGVSDAIREFVPPVIAIASAVFCIALLSYTSFEISKDGVERELVQLRIERDEIRQRLAEGRSEEDKKEENVFGTIQLSLNQITEYYTINKSQARNSFRFSVFAIVAGLATLIGGIWLFYLGETPDTELTIITGISGVLIEFIGGAYFYLYNKSLKQLNFFYEKLVKMQDTMLAIQLTESMSEEKEAELKERLIEKLMERSSEVKK